MTESARSYPALTTRARLLTVQSAECDDGMPPESTIARTSHTPVLARLVNICTSAAGGSEPTIEGLQQAQSKGPVEQLSVAILAKPSL